jgi:hypothetical protein
VNTGVYEDKDVLIRDARPKRAEITLEKNGFNLIDHKSKVLIRQVRLMQASDLRDMKELNEIYISEIEEFLKRLTSADKVIAFGPTVRQTKPQPSSHIQSQSQMHILTLRRSDLTRSSKI